MTCIKSLHQVNAMYRQKQMAGRKWRERMNRKNNRRPALQKEKIGIIAASVFVLSALTLAGVYMSSQGDAEKEENRIDFAKLEQGNNTPGNGTQENIAPDAGGEGLEDTRFVSGKAKAEFAAGSGRDARFTDEDMYDLSDNNDMDVDPAFTEVNSGQVENTKQENMDGAAKGTDKAAVFMDGSTPEEEEVSLAFSDTVALALPVVGDVIMDYSMDKAIYHTTMQQYRYNPALIVAAGEGQDITAAADGTVTDIYYDAQTGNTVCFDLGNGYVLTYGQLTDISVESGQKVSAGDIIGKVAKPTIYYTEEGSNIYYKLTKDGVPVDPLARN